MNNPLTDKEALDITLECMKDTTPLMIETDIKHAWLLVSWLQLVARHPGISAPMKVQLRKVAELYTNAVTDLHPEAAQLIAMGWNQRFDRGDEMSEDEIDWFNEHRQPDSDDDFLQQGEPDDPFLDDKSEDDHE